MNIEKIEPRDIHITIDISLKEVNMLLDYLNHCTMEFNSEDEPDMIKVKEFVENEFFVPLDRVTEEFGNGT